ncbi:GNAT family N-acetyltransferase [Saccharibacillus sp. JS10]|uniref:GNAT family N-acetyltransferase n=1 Tax=Saccharibacillus sp. JS10 TaxID=2950552 RepID=UPI00210A25B9|nr:GNAT family N-acetyltransferase [Saccharibacillus sp. JS10]MCQ4085575.1 GNAT family N-acetyltransferase [Saccharibacillus sp. JS10]
MEVYDSSLAIREASVSDAPILVEMLQEAAQAMVEQGIEQWKPEMFNEKTVSEYFVSRRVFILEKEHQAAGLFTLQNSDPSYWEELNDEDYLYLHRLTVRSAYRGLHYGEFMISFAEQEAIRLHKRGLRLDCVKHLPTLNEYYRRCGFQWIAERDLKRSVGGRYVNLYEKVF